MADKHCASYGGPEKEGGVVHIVHVLKHPRSFVDVLTARWLLVHERHCHPSEAQGEADHKRPKGARLVRSSPQYGTNVDGRYWGRKHGRHSLNVNKQLAALHLLDHRYPHNAGQHETDDKHSACSLLFLLGGVFSKYGPHVA